MRKLFLLAFIILFGISGNAQDYAPLQLGVKRYFINNVGYMRGIRVDSVVQELGYTRYKTFRTPRITSWNNSVADSNGACWIGQDIRAHANGDWVFPNKHGDPILVKTTATINDVWVFYADTSIFWYEARVVSVDTATVFGQPDSVRTIQLTAMKGPLPLLTHPVSAFQIQISKAHGFTQVPDLYEFPHDFNTPDTWYRWAIRWGYTPEQSMLFHHVVDWNALKTDIFDFNPGDFFGGSKEHKMIYWINGQYRDSVVSKRITGDTTNYDLKTWDWGQSWYNQPYQVYVGYKSFSVVKNEKIYTDTFFMPEEYRSGSYDVLYYLPRDTTFCQPAPSWEVVSRMAWGIYLGGLIYPAFETFQKEKGMVASHYSDGDGARWGHNMDYFRKAGTICGTTKPIPTAVEDVDLAKDMSLYPQPATDVVYLKGQIRFPVTALLQNAQGQMLFTQKLQSDQDGILTRNLSGGLYFLSVQDFSGNSGVLKVLINP